MRSSCRIIHVGGAPHAPAEQASRACAFNFAGVILDCFGANAASKQVPISLLVVLLLAVDFDPAGA